MRLARASPATRNPARLSLILNAHWNKERRFPGLWLDGQALLRGDKTAVLATLRRGLDSPEHRAFLVAV